MFRVLDCIEAEWAASSDVLPRDRALQFETLTPLFKSLLLAQGAEVDEACENLINTWERIPST